MSCYSVETQYSFTSKFEEAPKFLFWNSDKGETAWEENGKRRFSNLITVSGFPEIMAHKASLSVVKSCRWVTK